MFWYVYVLKRNDERSYTGCTDNLKDRIARHQKGQVLATKDRLPVKLITYFTFSNKYTAFAFEKYLKSGSVVRGEARKDSDIDMLMELPKGMSLFDFVDLQLKLEQVLERKVDLGEFSTIKPRLRDRILQEQPPIL